MIRLLLWTISSFVVNRALSVPGVSVSTPTSSSVSLQKRDNNGKISWYNPSIVGTGACGIQNAETDLVVAVDGDLWNNFANPANQNSNSLCGTTIFVSYQQVTKPATVVDYAPNLGGQYDLAVSTGVFRQLADQSKGILQGSWRFNNTPTPTSQNSPTTSVYSGNACQQTGFNPQNKSPVPSDCDNLFAQLAQKSGNFSVAPKSAYGFINGTCALQFCNYNSFTIDYDFGEFILYGTLIFSKYMNTTNGDSIAQCVFTSGSSGYIQVQKSNSTLNNQGSYSLTGRQFC